jgi:hypothetical protein
VAVAVDGLDRERQEVEAAGACPSVVGGREEDPDVAKGGRSEQGVNDGVDQDIGVGVPDEAAVVGDGDAAEDEGTVRAELMGVEAVADSHAMILRDTLGGS